MADWGSALGGIGYGIVGAQQDQYQRDEQQFLQTQRARMLQQQRAEDALQQRVRGISRDTVAEDRSGMGANEVGPSPATKSVPKTDEEYYGELADAYTQSGLPQYVSAGLGMKSTALQQQAARQSIAENDRKAAIQKRIEAAGAARAARRQAVMSGDTNHPEIANLHNLYNSNSGAYNDGYQAFPASTANGPMLNFYDAQGRLAGQRPMDQKSMLQMIDEVHGMELADIDPTYFYKNASLGIERGKLGVQQGELRIKEQKLPFETNFLTAQTNAQNSLPGLHAAQARAADAQAQLANYRSTMDKLPEGAKIELNKLGDIAKMAEHDANQDPNNPKLSGAAVRANINLWTALQRHKVVDPSFDVFNAAGAPPVETGVASLFKGKKLPTQQDIDTAVEQASSLYTPAYGARLRTAIAARMPVAQTPGDTAAPPTPTAASSYASDTPPRGISKSTPSAYAKQRQGETAARKAEADKRATARAIDQNAAAERLRNAGW